MALVASLLLTAKPALADDEPQPAGRFTSSDLLSVSERERRIWLNAFMAGAANALALRDLEAGRCLARWYDHSDDDQFRLINESLSAFPDNRPAEVIFALARRACPNLIAAD